MACVIDDRHFVDSNVFAVLPGADRILKAEEIVESRWAKGMRIDVKNFDDTEVSYFMKISRGHHGKEAIEGEFEATRAIHIVTPNFCPEPMAWGQLQTDPEAYFYLCKFHDFVEGTMPDPAFFCAKLATLHAKSGWGIRKFGFDFTTYNGDLPQDNTWADTWEEFFARGLRQALRLRDERAGGRNEKLDALLPVLFGAVIPVLLRPLEVRPSLIHGDLWYGNASVLRGSGSKKEALVYDPASFYGHHEYELGNWRPERNRFTKEYFDAYHSHVPKSEPVEHYDDRLKLYEMRFNLNAASLFPDQPQYLQMVIESIRELNEKFKDCKIPQVVQGKELGD